MKEIKDLIRELTAEEKIALVAGTDFMYTNPVSRLGINSLRMADGPHGLRVQAEGDNGVADSLPATAFPSAATIASSWNPENSFKIGRAIGKEAHKYGIHIVLGPGVNVKRNPKAGRNFEYFSEDPYLIGEMAAAQINGLQSEGVGVCVKHFALNNAENFRFTGNSVADMRAMREIYLKAFETIVKTARPAAMMCAYNKINGEYCSQNRWLLTDLLRKEWKFDGAVMTDWGAMHDRIASLKAGLDLEMPGDTAICRKWIADGLENGALERETLNEAVENVLKLVKKYAVGREDDSDFGTNDNLALETAKDSAVLLKNDGILPLDEGEKVLVCGELFEKMRYQGSGSSMISPTKLVTPREAFDGMKIRYEFVRGYTERGQKKEQRLTDEALKRAEEYEKVLVFAGLTDDAESEGCDREDMRLPENQLALIEALIGSGKKVAVIWFGGSPTELPFAESASAILAMYLPGQSGGKACAELLFGKANPAGRLAESWPLRYEDVPFGEEFAKTEREIYKESVFVGYRYYVTAGKTVRYPFGYGLSYTEFSWRGMQLGEEGEKFHVICEVRNTGTRDGAEVVQLYTSAPESRLFKPKRELRAFTKIYLKAGETKKAVLNVAKNDLRYFDTEKNKWILEGGEYRFELCSDAESVKLVKTVRIEGESGSPYCDEAEKAYRNANFAGLDDGVFAKMSGQKIIPLQEKAPITLESRFSDFADAGRLGKIVHRAVLGVANRKMKAALKMSEGPEKDNRLKGARFLKRILESNSLMTMTMCAGKRCPYNFAQGLAHLANGRLWQGLRCFFAKIKAPLLPKEKRR